MLIIGLTGGIGSGKSTVADCFSMLGIHVVDADAIAREVVRKNTEAYEKIVQRFGDKILAPTKEIDRNALRKKVFIDQHERNWLEKLLHPLIRKKMQEELSKAASPYAIAMIPLLFETAPNPIINRSLLVHTTEEQQIKRVRQRSGLTENEIKAIIHSQLSEEEKLKRADDVINNTGTLNELKQQVNKLHEKYLIMREI